MLMPLIITAGFYAIKLQNSLSKSDEDEDEDDEDALLSYASLRSLSSSPLTEVTEGAFPSLPDYGSSSRSESFHETSFRQIEDFMENELVKKTKSELLKESFKKVQLSQAQVRKLGEKITALHQLVSPFGKTDTASVLMEAIGYIKFLQDQIQVLSYPYLISSNNNKVSDDLRDRGLCLVPISCTMNSATNHNGADFWISSISGYSQ